MSPKSRKRRRRRRERTGGDAPSSFSREAADPARRSRSRADPSSRPPAPWGSFPLIEVATLIAIAMLVVGLIVGGERGLILIGGGLVIGSLSGLELSIREHLAGYRSHTLILAGVPAVVTLGVLFYLGPAGIPTVGRLGIAAAVFGLASLALVWLFRRRSGGYAFRVKAPRAGR